MKACRGHVPLDGIEGTRGTSSLARRKPNELMYKPSCNKDGLLTPDC